MKYGVDAYFTGHVHSYERYASVYLLIGAPMLVSLNSRWLISTNSNACARNAGTIRRTGARR
jgi:hypothetical protein